MIIDTHKLIKYSLITFLLFISIVFIIDYNHKVPTSKIEELGLKDLNKYISVESKTLKQNLINNKTLFLTIGNKNKTIPAIFFNTNKTLNPKSSYIFTGKITLYQKEIELILYEVKIKE